MTLLGLGDAGWWFAYRVTDATVSPSSTGASTASAAQLERRGRHQGQAAGAEIRQSRHGQMLVMFKIQVDYLDLCV